MRPHGVKGSRNRVVMSEQVGGGTLTPARRTWPGLPSGTLPGPQSDQEVGGVGGCGL